MAFNAGYLRLLWTDISRKHASMVFDVYVIHLPKSVRKNSYDCMVKERTAIVEENLTAVASSSLCDHLTFFNNAFSVRQP